LEQGGARAVLAADASLKSSLSDGQVGPWRSAGYDSWFDSTWGGYAFAVEARTLLHASGDLTGHELLDIGCGTGRFTSLFEVRGAVVTGLDLDPSMLALARGRVHGRLVEGDAHRLPFPAQSFDVTVAITLLEFLADPAQVVAEMARVTRPHGRLVIGTLDPRSPWGLAHRRRLLEAPWSSAHFLGRARLSELGSRHGRVALRSALYAPAAFPGLNVVGPLIEGLGKALPGWGAFQVLTVDLP
jgi:SAM-dependent methyltransferase